MSGRRPLVVALGGNALQRRGEPADPSTQRRRVAEAAAVLGELARRGPLVVTHGNGPQIGRLASLEAGEAHPAPLDVLGAETVGMIGYLLQQEIENAAPGLEVATLLTQTLVDTADPAFGRPTKPIGAVLDAAGAAEARLRGWTVVADGDGWRRAVPSPEPVEIIELPIVRRLVDAGVVVVCAGGGGVPVRVDASGAIHGVEAVVDKDLAAALVAVRLDAERLVLLTDVGGIEADFGTPRARVIPTIEADRVGGLGLPDGSMGPKAEACRRFVHATGRPAAIGALRDAAAIVEGRAGTQVVPAATTRGS